MTVGMQKSSAAASSLVRQTGIVYTFILEVVAVPSETLSLSTVVGALVIVIPVSILGVYRGSQEKKTEGGGVGGVGTADGLVKLPTSDEEEEDGGVVIETTVKTPLAVNEKSGGGGEDDEDDDDDDETGTETGTSYVLTPNKSKPSPTVASAKSGKYSTISRVGSDEDVSSKLGKLGEIGDEEVSSHASNETSFGFRWDINNNNQSSPSPQSWQSLTSHNWTDEDGTGWDHWGSGGNSEEGTMHPIKSNVINSVKSSLTSVFKSRGNNGGKVNAYRGIEFTDVDALSSGSSSIGLRKDAEVSLPSPESVDDDDVEFGV
jgi:hypothetical protein